MLLKQKESTALRNEQLGESYRTAWNRQGSSLRSGDVANEVGCYRRRWHRGHGGRQVC